MKPTSRTIALLTMLLTLSALAFASGPKQTEIDALKAQVKALQP